MGYVLRIGFRRLATIHQQTIVCASALNWSKRRFSFRSWLEDQAPELLPVLDNVSMPSDIPLTIHREETWHYAILLNAVLMSYESASDDAAIKAHFWHSMKSTSLSDHPDEDYAGADLGGSWDSDPFPFRAGIVITLGALEEFERGTIRILTGIQHQGLDPRSSEEAFKPRLKHFQASNPPWESLEAQRKTFTPRGRTKILKGFGIQRANTAWQQRLDAAWRDRNKIAHGLEPIKISLSRYLHVHYDAFTAMRHLSSESLKAQSVDL